MVYRDSNGRTFKKRATQGIILGIPKESKGYVVYLKEDKKVINTQHIKYIENLSNAQNAAILASPPSKEGSSNARNGGSVSTLNNPDSEEGSSLVTTRPPNQRKPSRRLRDAIASWVNTVESIDEGINVCNVNVGDPLTYKAAMSTKHAKAWQDAVDVELETLRNNCTWIAIQKPAAAKPLHSKWVFKTKLDADGGIERFKARLVSCGNEQQASFNLQRHLCCSRPGYSPHDPGTASFGTAQRVTMTFQPRIQRPPSNPTLTFICTHRTG
jgi:hypothetical protein